MRYFYNKRKRRKIDWIIDIICILICFMPHLIWDAFNNSFSGDNYFLTFFAAKRAVSYSLVVYAVLNFAAYYPQILMYFVTITDANREELVNIYNNMLNLIKVIAIPSLTVLTPIYLFFNFPILLLMIPLFAVSLLIVCYYVKEMKKADEIYLSEIEVKD